MDNKMLNRRSFLKRSSFTAITALTIPSTGMTSCSDSDSSSKTNINLESEKILKRTLFGTISPKIDLKKWFSSLKKWDVEQFWMYSPNYKGELGRRESHIQLLKTGQVPYQEKTRGEDFRSVGLLSDLDERYLPFIDSKEIEHQEILIENTYKECLENNLDFGYMIPFPLFPVQNLKIVKQVEPEYVRPDGRLNIYAPEMAQHLKKVVRHIKSKLPKMKSIAIWFAEGCGECYKFSHDDLVNNEKWLYPLLKAVDEISEELKIEGVVFSHDYFHTIRTHHQFYKVFSQFPKLQLLEDITWPEEDTLHPHWGFMPQEDRDLIPQNSTVLNFLTDTEYIGQGNWPIVLSHWTQYNVLSALRSNKVRTVAGRVFFWDRYCTDVNFNRINAYILTKITQDPNKSIKEILYDGCHEMFGPKISDRLIDILWDTENKLKDIISINNICPLNHSGFPLVSHLDKDYFHGKYNMKGINDLFNPTGTSLYPELSADDICSGNFWRYQDKTVAKSYEEYLLEKDNVIRWLEFILKEVKLLVSDLSEEHQKLFIDGYTDLLLLAEGMRIFVEVAKAHYDWHRTKTMSDTDFAQTMKRDADRLRILVNKYPRNRKLNLDGDMLSFANKIQTLHQKK